MAAQKRPSLMSEKARGSLKNGPLGSQEPGLGTPKKFCAVFGHPDWSVPEVLYTANDVLTPWRTQLVEAARAWSGGSQPLGGQIDVESAMPWKLFITVGVLTLAPGVAESSWVATGAFRLCAAAALC